MAASKTIEDYLSLQRGTTYKGSLVGKPGPALLGLGSIHPGGGFRADYKTYGGECPEKLMLQPGDLFVSLKGATKDSEMIGSVARVPASVPSGRLTQDTVKLILRTPSDKMGTYLYWLLRTPHYRKYCAAHATGSAVVALSREDFLSYPVPLFTAERGCIAKTLDNIEAKIELSLRMNETLEAVARAIFKSWFVDFNPVRVKAEGRQSSGMDATIAALFPDSFEDSPLGKIPRGWKVQTLNDVANFLNGLALQKYPPEDGESLPVIKIAQLRKSDACGADRASVQIPREYVIADGDILFSWSGSLKVEIWCGGPGALNQHLFKVTSGKYPKWFYLYWIRHHLADFQAIASGKATTMGHIQRHHLKEAAVLVPENDLLTAMDRILSPLVLAIIHNKLQSRTNAVIRDALLSKLISGEIRTPTLTFAESSAPIAVKKEQTGKRHATDEFKEAVLLSALVGVLATAQFPLGRKRYNKLIYLVHRKAAQQQQIGDRFMKKAAGPYSPWMRYQGPEGIAMKNGYVKRLNGSKGSGFVSGNNIGQIDKYISRYGFTDPLNWVVNAFRYRTNDDLELLTTIDFAVLDLLASGKPITVASVRDTIASEANWAPKLERTLFSEEKIAKALEELDQYFGLKQV